MHTRAPHITLMLPISDMGNISPCFLSKLSGCYNQIFDTGNTKKYKIHETMEAYTIPLHLTIHFISGYIIPFPVYCKETKICRKFIFNKISYQSPVKSLVCVVIYALR